VKAVIVGAGALGLGFLAERLAADYDLAFVDQHARAEFLGRLAGQQRFTANVCSLRGMRNALTSGTFAVASIDDPGDSSALNRVLAETDLVLTATNKNVLDKVAGAIAPALNARSRKVWVLFCENGLNIAESHRKAFGPQVTLLDTVMSRMCRFETTRNGVYQPLWPGYDTSLVNEDYDFFPLDASLCQGGPFTGAFSLVSPDQFRMWKDIKVYLHNGMQAYVSYHAYLAGAQRYPDTPAGILDDARTVMFNEVIPAITRTHACASREELERYGVSLLTRFVDPYFNDSIERGVRGAADKLAPDERLFTGCAYIRRAGIEPRGYASTIEAAKAIVAEQKPA
jgi:hypothetical protein